MRILVTLFALIFAASSLTAARPKPLPEEITQQQSAQMKRQIEQLKKELKVFPKKRFNYDLLDTAVCIKGAEWTLKHNQFFKSGHINNAFKTLTLAKKRINDFKAKKKPHWIEAGKQHACAYQSRIDDSIQPYALSLPKGFNIKSEKKWPLIVVLHGYNKRLNEPWFIQRFDGKPTPPEQTWVQLDVYGRGNNGYRWAGETDLFEAIRDVQRRIRVDRNRIAIWGFSMGGAGTWHLALHHPDKWAAAGAGAGFVDFYKYQNRTEKLPPYQHAPLTIYDSVNYALNNANIPMVAYCGELDKGMKNTQMMIEAGKKNKSPFKLIVGKSVGHKFTPKGKKEFIDFLTTHNTKGLPKYGYRKKIRFVTYTTKYNQCDWMHVEELRKMYQPAIVEGGLGKKDSSLLKLTTKNVRALQIDRDMAFQISIDGSDKMPLANAAEGLLPSVYYVHDGKEWSELDYDESRAFQENSKQHKRKNLQGPIDDAFMEAFLCVRGTGTPWSLTHEKWTQFTLKRFQNEYDKWLRATIPVITDQSLTEKQIEQKNLILFGDPGSNAIIAKVVEKLPIKWSKKSIEVAGKTYSTQDHGVCLIFPNPLNPDKYVVINSGHTMHENDFRGSNSNLYPRLGDIAVLKFSSKKKGLFKEETIWANIFDGNWKLPAKP